MLRGKAWLLVVVALVSVVAGTGGYLWWSQQAGQTETGRRPDLALPDLSGEPRSLDEWDGSVILLNFWASWCPPCVEEIPLLVDLQEKYGDHGLQIVGVAVDRAEDARDFTDRLGINYPVLHGVRSAMDALSRFGNAAGTLPYTVLIDRDGRIRRVYVVPLEPGEAEPEIERLLNLSASNDSENT